MGSTNDMTGFADLLRAGLKEHPGAGGPLAVSRAPAVVDVMGGIGEDTGALVVTATLALSQIAAVWPIAGADVIVRSTSNDDGRAASEFRVPAAELCADSPDCTEDLLRRAASAGMSSAAPACLVIRQAVIDGIVPRPRGGLMVLLAADLPADADLGRAAAVAAATLDSLCRLHGARPDRFKKGVTAARAVTPVTQVHSLRACLTALCGPADGAMLQLRFHPQLTCETLEPPNGVTVAGLRTKLERPTTTARMLETRLCAEMGHRMITELQRSDGVRSDRLSDRLSAITPAEFVERYRNRLPTRITGKAYSARFGALRAANGELGPTSIYKVRSRAEHHIYENRRAHEFAAAIVRARRNGDANALVRAGELMYASHWSHSQRCGIGGVEADQAITAIRALGPAAGLFGAKVTGGGAGGELVVLMRDDDRSRSALSQAVAHAEAASRRSIHVWRGSLPGAEFFNAADLPAAAVAPPRAVV